MKLTWDIYEVQSDADTLHGVMLRGRIRKFSIEKGITCLTENASDKENVVRFALLASIDPKEMVEFIKKLLSSVTILKVSAAIENPVLSKLKVNDLSRYTIN